MLRNYHIDLGTINPAELTTTNKRYLTELLNQNRKTHVFYAGKSYSFQLTDPQTKQFKYYQITPDKNILVRKCRKEHKGVRYELFNMEDVLGIGTNGIVLKSCGTLAFDPLQGLKYNPTAHAIKLQLDKELAYQEFAISNKTKHLKPRPVTSSENEARQTDLAAKRAHVNAKEEKTKPVYYMVMKLFSGKNLYKITAKEAKEKLFIDSDKRIRLSIAMPRALKEEMHDEGIINRDIKPENIMIDLAAETADILDCSDCKIINDPASAPNAPGSLKFRPPEQFSEMMSDEYTTKSDNYMMGKTLAEFWGAIPAVKFVTSGEDQFTDDDYILYRDYALKDTEYDFTQFKYGDLSNQHAEQIQQIICELTRAIPDERLELSDAIKRLENILQERQASRNVMSM